MKNLFIKLIIWIMWKIFKGGNQLDENIREMYRMRAQHDLILKADIVPVKNKKAKYDLLIFETKEGIRKFNLGRNLRHNPDEIVEGMI